MNLVRHLLVLVPLTISCAYAAEPMTYEQLKICAGYTQSLQTRAPALLAQDQENARLRDYYNAGNGRHEDKLAFNQHMAQYRAEVAELNRIKQAYTDDCLKCDVSPQDVERLPEPLRGSWRRGLADVQVPYLGPSTAP